MTAVGVGTVGQVRIMGGAVILSVATSVFHSYTRRPLHALIGTPEIDPNRVHAQGPFLENDVRQTFAQGYKLQMVVLAAFSGAQVLAVLLVWRKKQVRI